MTINLDASLLDAHNSVTCKRCGRLPSLLGAEDRVRWGIMHMKEPLTKEFQALRPWLTVTPQSHSCAASAMLDCLNLSNFPWSRCLEHLDSALCVTYASPLSISVVFKDFIFCCPSCFIWLPRLSLALSRRDPARLPPTDHPQTSSSFSLIQPQSCVSKSPGCLYG